MRLLRLLGCDKLKALDAPASSQVGVCLGSAAGTLFTAGSLGRLGARDATGIVGVRAAPR